MWYKNFKQCSYYHNQMIKVSMSVKATEQGKQPFQILSTLYMSLFALSTLYSCVCCAVHSHSVVSDPLYPHGLLPARLLWEPHPRQEYWSGLPCPPSGDLLNPGIEPRSPALQSDSLPSEPLRKPKGQATGAGSLSLLQGIFPAQEPNQGFLYCRHILHQLSYQGSPYSCID